MKNLDAKQNTKLQDKKGSIVPIIFTMHRILEYLHNNSSHPIELKNICSQLNIPRTTASRILQSLYLLGYLKKNIIKPTYHLLDDNFFSYHYSKIKIKILKEKASEIIQKLAKKLGETVKFNIWENNQVQVLCISQGSSPMHIQILKHENLPWHAGAGGKVLLAYQEDSLIKELLHDVLRQGGLLRFTESTICDLDMLRAEIDQIRSDGFACDRQEFVEGLEALAVPVLIKQESPLGYVLLGSISIPYIANNKIRDQVMHNKERLMCAAQELAQQYRQSYLQYPIENLPDGISASSRHKVPKYQINKEVLKKVAQSPLEQLAQKLGETTKLSIWDEQDSSVEVLCTAIGNNKMHIQVPVGVHFPWYAGAASKVLLAFSPYLSPEYLAQLPPPKTAYTAHTIIRIDDQASELEKVRAEGLAYDRQEYQEGIEAIACPVFYQKNVQILGALSIPHISSPAICKRIYSQKNLILSYAEKIGQAYQKAYI